MNALTERRSIARYLLPTYPSQNTLAFGSLLSRCRLATKTHGAHGQKPGFRPVHPAQARRGTVMLYCRRCNTLHLILGRWLLSGSSRIQQEASRLLLEVAYAYCLMLTFMLTHNYSMLHVEDLTNAPLGLLPPMTSSGNKAS